MKKIRTESEKKIFKDEVIGYGLLISVIPIIFIALFTLIYIIENDIVIHSLIGMLLLIGFMALFIFVYTAHDFYISDKGCHQETIVIDSKIVSVKSIMGKNVWDKDIIRFLDVSFSDGKNYLIDVTKNLDLTVASKLILSLHRDWRYDKLLSDAWEIDNIIKVP